MKQNTKIDKCNEANYECNKANTSAMKQITSAMKQIQQQICAIKQNTSFQTILFIYEGGCVISVLSEMISSCSLL